MFWSRPLVTDTMRDWVDDCFDWFDITFGTVPVPVMPTRAFFKSGSGRDVETARSILEEVKGHLRVTEAIEIMPINVLPDEHRGNYQDMGTVAGTFQHDGDAGVITYDPALMRSPIQFINILSHEVMHAKLHGREEEAPGGVGAHELLTDLGCIIMGFGVFQLQAAEQAGWSGYLTQPTRAHALATFLTRRDLGLDTVVAELSPRNVRLLRKAFKML